MLQFSAKRFFNLTIVLDELEACEVLLKTFPGARNVTSTEP